MMSYCTLLLHISHQLISQMFAILSANNHCVELDYRLLHCCRATTVQHYIEQANACFAHNIINLFALTMRHPHLPA